MKNIEFEKIIKTEEIINDERKFMLSTPTYNISKVLPAIIKDVGKLGIGKDQINEKQGYKFRGIDQVYDVLNNIFSQHQLCIIPKVLCYYSEERQTKTGGINITRIVEVEYKLLASDGSFEMARSIGEANDTSDKAMNKAITAAWKYLMFQLFCIPIQGNENDADNEGNENDTKTEIETKTKIDKNESKEMAQIRMLFNLKEEEAKKNDSNGRYKKIQDALNGKGFIKPEVQLAVIEWLKSL